MQKECIYRLIVRIGGLLLPGENTKAYLDRVSGESGVGYASLRAAYYGRDIGPNLYVSSKTVEKLEWAAKNADHTDSVIAFTKYYLDLWEDDPETYRDQIDAARTFISRLRRFDEEGNEDAGIPGFQTRGLDAGEG